MSKNNTSHDYFAVIRWAKDVPGPKGLERALLIDLASSANKELVCWPGYGSLANRYGKSERSISRYIDKLVELELIEKKNRGSTSNLYRVNLSNPTPVSGYEKPQPDTSVMFNQTPVSGCNQTPVSTKDTSTKKPVEETNPADSPQVEAHKVYSVWEKGLEKYQTTIPVLTGKEKKQLKDAARAIAELDPDPIGVIHKTVTEWDRFKAFTKKEKVAFTIAANPDTGQFVKFARQAVEFYRADELQAAQDAAWQTEQAEAKAKAEEGEAALRKREKARESFFEDFMLADSKYCELSSRVSDLEAKETQTDFGMTEDDLWIDFFGDGVTRFIPCKAWQQHKANADDEIQTYLRESGLVTRAEQAWSLQEQAA